MRAAATSAATPPPASCWPGWSRACAIPFKKQVPAGVKTPQEFLEFAKEEFERDYGPEKMEAMNQEYRLLGLIDPDLELYRTILDLLESQVGGFYDPKSETFYMMSTVPAGMMADIIMAHELTHALDDQYYELDKILEDARDLSSDAEFALRAVAEGSGTSLMNLYSVKGILQGWIKLRADDSEQMQEMMEISAAGLENAPPFLIMSLALPYLEGNKFLVQQSNLMMAMAQPPTQDDLDRAFREPPLSSEQVLHFEKYWDPERRDDPVRLELSDLSAELGEGWSLADSDTFGELACYVLTAEVLPDLASAAGQLAGVWTNEAATGWGGDRLQLYRGPDGCWAALWATVWDTPDDAGEFSTAYAEAAAGNPFLRARLDGETSVLLIYANEAAQAAGAGQRLRELVETTSAELLR